MSDELPTTIAGLARAYRRARDPLSPLDVVEATLARVEALEPAIRAYVTVTPERARRAARRAAQRLADGDPSPLLGVPLAVKDLIDVRGVPTTAGSRVLADNVARRDAPAWARARQAGAVLVGKANTHEFAYGGTTEPTRNPWALDRMVGGSSGGPAAAVAGGLCVAAIGTDTAGSIRIPANLCGVCGLKPTNRAISTAGVIPLAPSLDVVGPLARTVEDAATLFAVLAGKSQSDVDAEAARVARERADGRLRIGLIRELGPASPGVAQGVLDAAAAAAGQGIDVVERDPGQTLRSSVFANFTLLGVEAAEWHERYADRRDLYTPYVRERLEEAAATSARAYRAALAQVAMVRAAVDEALADVDALLLPGVPFPAPVAGVEQVDLGAETIGRDLGLCRNTGFANLSAHPVLAVPAGFEGGLPVGVQLVGRRGHDLRLLALGRAISEELAVPTLAPGEPQAVGTVAS